MSPTISAHPNIAPVLQDAHLLLSYLLTMRMCCPWLPVNAAVSDSLRPGCRRPGVLVLVNDVDWELRYGVLPCTKASVDTLTHTADYNLLITSMLTMVQRVPVSLCLCGMPWLMYMRCADVAAGSWIQSSATRTT